MSNPHPAEPAFWARNWVGRDATGELSILPAAVGVDTRGRKAVGDAVPSPKGGYTRRYPPSRRLTTIAFSPNEMPKSTSPELSGEPATYEDALAELESLVAAMEGGQLPLDRLLASYQRGAELLSFCRGRLEAIEQQVKVLEDGQLKPWNEA